MSLTRIQCCVFIAVLLQCCSDKGVFPIGSSAISPAQTFSNLLGIGVKGKPGHPFKGKGGSYGANVQLPGYSATGQLNVPGVGLGLPGFPSVGVGYPGAPGVGAGLGIGLDLGHGHGHGQGYGHGVGHGRGRGRGHGYGHGHGSAHGYGPGPGAAYGQAISNAESYAQGQSYGADGFPAQAGSQAHSSSFSNQGYGIAQSGAQAQSHSYGGYAYTPSSQGQGYDQYGGYQAPVPSGGVKTQIKKPTKQSPIIYPEDFQPSVYSHPTVTGGKGGIKTATGEFLEESRSQKLTCKLDAIPIENASIKCRANKCKATCYNNYKFPSGEDVLILECINNQWKVDKIDWNMVPSCSPVCMPPCANNGICIAPGQCDCPENFSGPTCDKKKILCVRPLPYKPKNAKITCNDASCAIQCLKGHKFVDGTSITNLNCIEGNWKPTNTAWSKVPDCKAICDPPCQNGGECYSQTVDKVRFNNCSCTKQYRGPQCQYHVDVCSPKKLKFNGGYNCTGDMRSFYCRVYCPPSVPFEYPPAEKYVCDYERGLFQPRMVPQCVLQPGMTFVQSGDKTQYGYEKGRKETSFSYKEKQNTIVEEEEDWEETIIRIRQKIKRKKEKQFGTGEYEETEYEIPGTYTMYSSSGVDIAFRTPAPALCTTWNGKNVKTFDGLIYTVPLYCSHTLVQDYVDGSFNIVLVACDGDLLDFCPHTLKVFLQNLEYTFTNKDGVVQMSTEHKTWPIPVHITGMKVTPVAQNLKIDLETIGLIITWDMYQRVQVEAGATLWNRTAGLCGTLDKDSENDFKSKDGALLTTPKTFVDSWRIQDKCGMDLSEMYVIDTECDPSYEQKAISTCQKLLSNAKLHDCLKDFSRSALIQFCYNDFCNCAKKENPASCSCQFVSTLAKDCQLRGIKLEHGWRDLEICPVNCTGGKIYLPCGPSMEPMCGSTTVTTKTVCTEGCFCPEGTIRYKDECISVEQCPCRLRKKEFKPGSQIKKDCNTCTCESGTWKCTDITCGARCGAVGDPHYVTFDGKRYDFMGKCSYYLLKTDNMTVEAENIACPGSISEGMNFAPTFAVDMPSCTKSLTINLEIDGEPTSIKLRQGRLVYVDNEEVTRYPKPLGVYGNVVMRQASSTMLSVDFTDGVRIWWDGMTRAYIDVPSTYRGRTKGLCGTFNSQQNDDFLTPEGDIEGVEEQFANKWRTKEACEYLADTKPPHPCTLNVEKREIAEKLCSKIHNDIFDNCHWSVDPDTFYEDCLYDVCACKGDVNSCFCPILAAYGAECSRQNIITNWRYNIPECAVTCPAGQVYDECGDSCVRTCEDVANQHVCRGHCVEGCRCPPGQYLNDKNECIPAKHCPCIYDGFTFETGYREVRPGRKFQELCTCDSGIWECDEAKPGDEMLYPPASLIKAQCTNMPYAEFTKCLPLEQKTCKNMHEYKEDYKGCKPGCGCKAGYVLDVSKKECVLPQNCSCHHGGISYDDGEQIKEDCNTCKCKGGHWDCTQKQCAASCSVWGDSHFTTFDNKEFEFQGECDYVLSKGSLPSGDGYEISIQNVLCGSLGVTCSKSVEVSLTGAVTDTIKLSSDPLQTSSLQKYKKITPESANHFTVYNAGVFVVVEVPSLGLQIKWDRGTRVYVKLNQAWKNKVSGLCGNYNGNEQDDMKTPSLGIETSSLLFGHSWKLEDSCSVPTEQIDACREHPERKTWAQRKCGILKSKTFQACHSEVPVDKYLKRCTFDTCACDQGGDCECLCTAIAAYVYECATKGINIKWRTPHLCPMQCDAHCSYYSECVPSCPVETCDNYLEQGMSERMCMLETCFEGCAIKPCEEGKIYFNDSFLECVPKSECKPICMVKDGATFYEGDITQSDDCHTCRCSRKKEICTGIPCTTTHKPIVTQPPELPQHIEDQECVQGWTKWFNEDESTSGSIAGADVSFVEMPAYKQNDVERIPKSLHLQSIEGYGICSKKHMHKIECRTVGTHLTPDQTGENVDCLLEKGLICVGDCHDYEIRVYCDCSDTPSVTTTAPWILPEIATSPPIVYLPTPQPDPVGQPCLTTHEYLKHPSDCTKFLQCVPALDGKFTYAEKMCGPGTMFNPQMNVCDMIATVVALWPECAEGPTVTESVPHLEKTPSPIYKPKSECDNLESVLPVTDDCYKYQQCLHHINGSWSYVNRTCGPEMMFNPVSKMCDWYASVIVVRPECTRKPRVDETVTVPAPVEPLVGEHCDPSIPNAKHADCTKFIQCVQQMDGAWMYVVKECPPGTMYHPNSMICDHISVVKEIRPECGKPPAPVPGALVTEPPPMKIVSPHVPSTVAPCVPLPPIDCFSYHECAFRSQVNGYVQVVKNCGPYLMYNPVQRKCDSLEAVIAIKPECSSQLTTDAPVTPPIEIGLVLSEDLEVTDGPLLPPLAGQPCDPAVPNVEHPDDCAKFLQCLQQMDGMWLFVEKICGIHTMYNPRTMICDWPASVAKLKPQCGTPPVDVEVMITTPETHSSLKMELTTPPLARECDPHYPYVEFPGDCHKYLYCEQLPNGEYKYMEKNCGTNMFNPSTGQCDRPTSVIEIRPDCEIPDTTTVVPITARCPPGKVWSECAIPCGRACHYYKTYLFKEGLCKPYSNACEEGCIDEHAVGMCSSNLFWRDMETCVEIANCPCMSGTGVLVKPSQKYDESDCQVCQCVDNAYICTTKAKCVEEVESTPTAPPEPTVKVTKPPIKVIIPATVSPPAECDRKYFVPMISGKTPLPDSAITASSVLGPFFAPQYSRLNSKPSDSSAGSWSPALNDDLEYLLVTFPEATPLYGVILQGSPLYHQYVTQFKILHSLDGYLYHYLIDQTGNPQIFDGPVDSNTPVESLFRVPIEAKYVRIYPLKWVESIAIRVELLGCSKIAHEIYPSITPKYEEEVEEHVTPSVPSITVELDIIPLCDDPMGVENGQLSISQVSASSIMPTGTKGKEPPLLHQLKLSSPRGWRPVLNSANEFVMFDFLEPRNLTGVKTVGGPSSWVTAFQILYSHNGFVWNKLKTPEGLPKIFIANNDAVTPKVNYFKNPIHANFLKIVPIKWHNSIEMKVEPLGCFHPYPVTEVPVITVTPPVEIVKECGVCDGVQVVSSLSKSQCLCEKPLYWNGEACVDKSQCPCMVGHIPYEVGAKYETEDCQHCICLLGGVSQCKKKTCPPCAAGLRRAKFGCACLCEECPEFQRLCPSSGDCIPEALWCNGVKDCEDDETDCQPDVKEPDYGVEETEVYNVTKVCPEPYCPPGMILQAVEKKRPLKMSAVFGEGSHRRTSSASKKKVISSPTFVSTTKRRRVEQEAIEECFEYICIPEKKPLISEDHTKTVTCQKPMCNDGYEIELDSTPLKPNECPTYSCILQAKKDVVCITNGRTFKTFDDSEFKYDICSHMLARNLGYDTWSVTLYKNCTVGDYQCLKELAIRDKESGYEMWLYQDLTVKLNGIPYKVRQLESSPYAQNDFIISQPGQTILLVSRPHGFWVSFDVNGDVKIGVSSKYIEQVDGLCGYYNGVPGDDKRLPDGKLASSTGEFGDAWFTEEIPKSHCEPHACSHDVQEKALKMCSSIRHEIFSPCIKSVDYDRFISQCLETACDCIKSGENDTISDTEKNCKCAALQGFVKQCLVVNPTAILDAWRPIHGCEVDCPAPLIHRDCFKRRCEPSCSNVGTEECPAIPDFCFSGCYCPEGTVRKGSSCVPATECRDCICDSLPNSNYLTYDRQNFTFDGNCTYLLTRDIMLPGVHTFQVYATMGECQGQSVQPTKASSPMKLIQASCAKSLHILYGEHIIHVQRNDDWTLKVMVDGIFVDSLPFNNPWINVKKELGKDLSILLPESQVEVISSFNDLSFSIRVPSIKFGSTMEGLCGDCNGNPNNDLQINPIKIKDYPSPSFLDIVNSWQADEPKLGLPADTCVTEEEAVSDCLPLPSETDPCFKLFDEETFGRCHMIVDPSIYISNCQQDMCKPGMDQVGACASLAAYARECARHGICLEWRTPDFCPFDCPSNLQYDACGCTFTCETVKYHGIFDVIMTKTNTAVKTKKSQLQCLEDRAEGCYCPPGTVFNHNKCIKQENCIQCDEEGHYPGDFWYPDKCTKCTCNTDGKTVCSKEVCGVQDTICPEGFDAQQIESTTECCPKFICVPKPTSPPVPCPEVTFPDCPTDQQKKLIQGVDGCPYYICECKPPSECSHLDIERPLKEGESVVMDKSGCCEVPKIVCDKTKCRPKPEQCPNKFYEVVETLPDDCCPSYDCVPPKHACIVYLGGLEVLKNVGERWKSPEDPCVEKVCSLDSTGVPAVLVAETTTCEKCSKGYEPALSPGECCGKCVATRCVVGDQLYYPEQTWYSSDNCTSSLCVVQDGSFHVIQSEKKCPDISECPPELRYVKDCCTECKLIPESQMNCLRVPINSTMGAVQIFVPIHRMCVNKAPIPELTECQGACPSGTKFNPATRSQDKFCDCCHPTGLKTISVTLSCDDGYDIDQQIQVPTGCSCRACDNENEFAHVRQTEGVKGGVKGGIKG